MHKNGKIKIISFVLLSFCFIEVSKEQFPWYVNPYVKNKSPLTSQFQYTELANWSWRGHTRNMTEILQ